MHSKDRNDIIESGEYYTEIVNLLYNGDEQPLFVTIYDGKITLFKKSIYDSVVSYIMVDNKFMKEPTNIEDFIYDLVRFLPYKFIETVLNESGYIPVNDVHMFIHKDVDRCYNLGAIYYDEKWCVVEPSIDGYLYLSKEIYGDEDDDMIRFI